MPLTQLAFMALMLAALTSAFSRGGRPERIGGALLLTASLVSSIAEYKAFADVEIGIAAIDAVLLAALIWLAFDSERGWAIIAVAFQFVTVLTHVARLKTGHIDGMVYAYLLVIWSYPVVLALLWGSLFEARRKSAIAPAQSATPERSPQQAKNAVDENTNRQLANGDDLALLTRLLTLHDIGPESPILAARLLEKTGSYAGAVATPPAKLRSWDIDERVVEAFAFSRKATRTTLRRKLEIRPSFANGLAAVDYLHSEMAHLPQEQVRVLYLNARHRLIRDEILGEGSIAEAPIFPREIMRHAIDAGALYLILAHNHPSGDPAPSRADITATRAVIEAARPMGVSVIDHLVISATGHVSMRSSGLI